MKFAIKVLCFSVAGATVWLSRPAPTQFVAVAAEPTSETSNQSTLDSTFTPIQYFQNQCSRCHGFYGQNYGEDLMKLDDARLKQYVDEMAAGPGQAPLEAQTLEIETAYHRSLQDKKPFVIVTQIEKSNQAITLRGEVTPGSAIKVLWNGQSVDAKTNEHNWQAQLPLAADEKSLQIGATKEGITTTIQLNETRYSHGR